MTDEKIIDAEFSKDDCGPFNSPISAYKAGFRAAERLAKIEVLESVITVIDCAYPKQEILSMIAELKAGQ